MRVNAASLDIRDATTSTPGTLNDLTTDLIMANNNNNNNNTCRTRSEVDNQLQAAEASSRRQRIIHTDVPQGSKLSPTLFSFYIADMPQPTEPVKRICYADDITVWAPGVKI